MCRCHSFHKPELVIAAKDTMSMDFAVQAQALCSGLSQAGRFAARSKYRSPAGCGADSFATDLGDGGSSVGILSDMSRSRADRNTREWNLEECSAISCERKSCIWAGDDPWRKSSGLGISNSEQHSYSFINL